MYERSASDVNVLAIARQFLFVVIPRSKILVILVLDFYVHTRYMPVRYHES
jgi:hypothetical protein